MGILSLERNKEKWTNRAGTGSPLPVPKLSGAEAAIQYKTYEEQVAAFNAQAEMACYSRACVRCEKHGQASIIFACDHCHEQDPVRPIGIIFTPFRYFICNGCYRSYQLGRLNFWLELKVRCWPCILDEWNRIDKINPKLNKDWVNKPKR